MSAKKILSICLSIPFFVSCGDIVDQDQFTPSSNPLLGVWNNYHEDTDSLVMTRVFTKEFYSYFTFADGKMQNELNKQSYYIEDNLIRLKAYTQSFERKSDTLWITNSSQDQITKYIKVR